MILKVISPPWPVDSFDCTRTQTHRRAWTQWPSTYSVAAGPTESCECVRFSGLNAPLIEYVCMRERIFGEAINSDCGHYHNKLVAGDANRFRRQRWTRREKKRTKSRPWNNLSIRSTQFRIKYLCILFASMSYDFSFLFLFLVGCAFPLSS